MLSLFGGTVASLWAASCSSGTLAERDTAEEVLRILLQLAPEHRFHWRRVQKVATHAFLAQ